ncbi:MAG TPA: S1 RNA-binding domain-containing protein, partial [Denitromonas sp.]|nr:S1 RNA-binding domain-containing protein [Denitromonas sp.]
PEAYPLVEKILADIQRDVASIIGDSRTLKALDARRYADDRFGEPTVNDILAELDKPGRDPRPAFRTAAFRDGVEKLSDLTEGMVLEGVVTNVTNFGAFVDIGVHQDGLVHISALSDTFVKDPRTVVKAGDVVPVKVLEVDLPRKRIALTMRLSDTPADARKRVERKPADRPKAAPRADRAPRKDNDRGQGNMAAALAKALKK